MLHFLLSLAAAAPIAHCLRARLRRVQPVLTDLDGTLLAGSGLSGPAQHAWELAAAADVELIVATGRCPASASKAVGRPLERGIFLNGALIQPEVAGAPRRITFDVAEEVVAAAQAEMPRDAVLLAVQGDTWFSDDIENPMALHLHEQYGEPRPTAVSSLSQITAQLLALVGRAEVLDHTLAALRQRIGSTAVVLRALPTAITITSPEATKGKATQVLLSLLNREPGTEVCIGDQENDVPILERCSIGVAMQNAPQSTKEKAEFETHGSNTDGKPGVIEVLELIASAKARASVGRHKEI